MADMSTHRKIKVSIIMFHQNIFHCVKGIHISMNIYISLKYQYMLSIHFIFI